MPGGTLAGDFKNVSWWLASFQSSEWWTCQLEFRGGHAKTSDVRVQDPEMETFWVLKLAYIDSCVKGWFSGFHGFTGRMAIRYLEHGPEDSRVVQTTEMSQWRVTSWSYAVMDCQKMCYPIPFQLGNCSGWVSNILSKIVVIWSNRVIKCQRFPSWRLELQA